MHCKQRKSKEPHPQSRHSTAKKLKKSKQNDAPTPSQPSPSRGQLHDLPQHALPSSDEQITQKKKPLKSRQMKMMVRCLQQYCSFDQYSCEQLAKRYQLTARLFHYLQRNYILVGRNSQVLHNQRLIDGGLGHAEIKCEYCEDLGFSCNQLQLEMMEQRVNEDINKLEERLLQQLNRGVQIQHMGHEASHTSNKILELEHLRNIEALQQEVLRKLEDQQGRPEHERSPLFLQGRSSVSLEFEDVSIDR